MLRIGALVAVLSAMAAGCACTQEKVATSGTNVAASSHGGAIENPNLGKVRHVVIFKFKDSATPEQIKAVEVAFRALPSKIPQIRDFEWGTNNSPEGLSQGFTHCFFLTFENEKDRDAYLPHPEHKKFGQSLGPILDKVMVIDYKAQK
ncbi:MAG TPA: Dabb family protein [Tepidisphaeraceae bacterium]|nr:Dabb family protein [Tepidisphaeraceae bacterium]